MAHRHAALIKKWADGAQIQTWVSNRLNPALGTWADVKNPRWRTDSEYRVKPVTQWYRVAKMKRQSGDGFYPVAAGSEEGEKNIEAHHSFIEWLADRIEYTA